MRNMNKLFNAVVFVFGMIFFAGSMAEAQVAVSLPNVTGQVGVSKSVALTVGSLASQNVTSFQFTLTYDSTVVNITGVTTTGAIADAYKSNLLVNTSVRGQITVAAAGVTALTGSGALLNLNVVPLKAGNSALTLSQFSFNEGTPAATITNGQFSIPSASFIVPDTTAKAAVGGALSIPIKSDDLASLNVMAYNLTITFDPAVVLIDGFSTTGTLSSAWTLTKNTATPGTIKIAGAGTTKLSGKGILLNLTGKVVAAGMSPITFTSVVLNEGSPVIGSGDGSVTITLNVKPVYTSALKDTTIKENQALTFTYAATDVDSVTYSFAGTVPTGATLNATTGVFAWTPNYTQSGVYTIAVLAKDPSGLYDSTSAKITVTNVNRAPVKGAFAPAQKIDSVTVGTNVYFKATATDADGDAITYTWKLNGAQVKSGADSTYTFNSNVVSTSTQTVMCVFSDGNGGADSVSWAFKVVKSNTLDVDNELNGVPGNFVLGQNYPNPFNPSTSIKFGLPKAAPVTLEIYNVLGVKVRTLLNGAMMSASYHNVTWNGKDDNGTTVTSGMYLYRISADKFVSTMKMMLMK